MSDPTIRAAREAAGLTQRAAAERAGWRQETWQKYEFGTRSHWKSIARGLDTLEKIASALGVRPASLLPAELVARLKKILR